MVVEQATASEPAKSRRASKPPQPVREPKHYRAVVRRSRGRVVRVESLADFDRRVEAGATRLSGWRVAGVDLRDRDEVLAGLRVAGATFLGCTFGPGVEERIERAGALVLPPLTIAPVDVYRSSLYTAEELYDGRAVPALAGRPGLRLVPDPRQRRRCSGSLAARPRDRRGAHGVDPAQAPGRRDGRPRGAPRRCGVRRRRPSRARARRALRGRHRRRPRRDGGRQPRVLPGRLPRLAGHGRRRCAGRGAGVPALGRRVAAARPRASAPSSPSRTTRSGSRPGTTVTSRRTSSPPASPSTSATPPARRSSSRSATPASCSCPAPAAPSRRSSRTRARTTTPTSPRSPRWCWSAGPTGPRPCPPGRCSATLARGRPMEHRVHLVDTVEDAAALLVRGLRSNVSEASWARRPRRDCPSLVVTVTVNSGPVASSPPKVPGHQAT